MMCVRVHVSVCLCICMSLCVLARLCLCVEEGCMCAVCCIREYVQYIRIVYRNNHYVCTHMQNTTINAYKHRRVQTYMFQLPQPLLQNWHLVAPLAEIKN
jgi:hypothetical protein